MKRRYETKKFEQLPSEIRLSDLVMDVDDLIDLLKQHQGKTIDSGSGFIDRWHGEDVLVIVDK